MKRIIVCFFCGVLALQLSAGEPEKRDADVFAAADWNWQPLGKGAEYGSAQLNLFESTQFISVIRYKARRYKTDIEGVDVPSAPTWEIQNLLVAEPQEEEEQK